MDQKKLYEAIEITKREGAISPSVLSRELSLNDEEIQSILQTLQYTDFIDSDMRLSSLKTESFIDRKDEEYTELRKKKINLEAWLALSVVIIILIFVAQFI